MNRRLFRLLPLFVAALWLPFQAIAATAMPFCGHGEARKAAAMADEMADGHCQMHDQQQPAQPEQGKGCDDCGFCQLAASGFMPAVERGAPVIPSVREFRADVEHTPASAVLEPPQQPPDLLT